MERLLGWGLVDTYRHANPEKNDQFSWFDYRSKGFDDNRGLRIDLLLASKPLAERCEETGIDYEIRSMESRPTMRLYGLNSASDRLRIFTLRALPGESVYSVQNQ